MIIRNTGKKDTDTDRRQVTQQRGGRGQLLWGTTRCRRGRTGGGDQDNQDREDEMERKDKTKEGENQIMSNMKEKN